MKTFLQSSLSLALIPVRDTRITNQPSPSPESGGEIRRNAITNKEISRKEYKNPKKTQIYEKKKNTN